MQNNCNYNVLKETSTEVVFIISVDSPFNAQSPEMASKLSNIACQIEKWHRVNGKRQKLILKNDKTFSELSFSNKVPILKTIDPSQL